VRREDDVAILHPNSLIATVDAVNEAVFRGRAISKADAAKAAGWIVDRQGIPGAYRGMFAPTAADFAKGAVLFTGEKMRSHVGCAHVMGEEACRALLLLGGGKSVKDALVRATAWMAPRPDNPPPKPGWYCCHTCSVAMWRHLAVSPARYAEALLAGGLKVLKSRRDGDGRWRSFSFYYTLLALTDIDLPAARAEMAFVAPTCEKLLKRPLRADKFSRRRRMLLERVVATA
jgi:hypothetical protein